MRQREQHRAQGTGDGCVQAATVLFSMPSAHAEDGTAYALSDVQCDPNFNGVFDLTLVNEQSSQPAMFVISPAGGSVSAAVGVVDLVAAAWLAPSPSPICRWHVGGAGVGQRRRVDGGGRLPAMRPKSRC